MPVKIELESLFKENLIKGINIFTGAGFSVLEDKGGKKLLTASQLCGEIRKVFEVPDAFGDDLETISTIVDSKYRQQYQQFLRQMYTVNTYNSKYDTINKINISSFITTNIDNIIHCVMDNSKRYYLNSTTYYGATKKRPGELLYLPIHGDVLDHNSHLYFGKFDLALVGSRNEKLFDIMFSQLSLSPTLFWGYGFHDDGVKQILARILLDRRHDIWVQCQEEGSQATLFRELGCHIIIGGTDELLEWIEENAVESADITLPNHNSSIEKYMIPSLNQTESVTPDDFLLAQKLTGTIFIQGKHMKAPSYLKLLIISLKLRTA